jgi:hypothetical protein
MPKLVTNNSTRLLRIGVSVKDNARYVTLMPGDNVVSDEDWKLCMANARARAWCEKGTLKNRMGKLEKGAILTVEDAKEKKVTTTAKKGAGPSAEEKKARKKQEEADAKAAEKAAKGK